MGTTYENFRTIREASRFTQLPTLGKIFFVNSQHANATAGGGRHPDNPCLTLAQAVALCTANQGDRIYLAPNHSESIGASGVAVNVAGIEIIGLGKGNNRATFTWSATDAVLTISAAGVSIENIITKVSIDEVVSMILVTGAGVSLDAVDFIETASVQAIQWLLTTNAADYLTIKNCFHQQITAAGSAQKWIQLVGVDCARIQDNTFLITANASTGSHLISGSTAVVNCYIARNTGLFLGASITIIVNLVTGSTGYIGDNKFGSGTSVATTAAYTGDACFMMDNKWADTAAASGLLAPAVDTDT